MALVATCARSAASLTFPSLRPREQPGSGSAKRLLVHPGGGQTLHWRCAQVLKRTFGYAICDVVLEALSALLCCPRNLRALLHHRAHLHPAHALHVKPGHPARPCATQDAYSNLAPRSPEAQRAGDSPVLATARHEAGKQIVFRLSPGLVPLPPRRHGWRPVRPGIFRVTASRGGWREFCGAAESGGGRGRGEGELVHAEERI